MFTRIYGHKHGNKHLITVSTLVFAFTFASVLPHTTLAFESQLSSATTAKFTAPVQLAGRDPYLAQAIDNLPSYTYLNAGTTASMPSPVTIVGEWPVQRQWAPVQFATAPVAVTTTVTDAVPAPKVAQPTPATVKPAAGAASLVMQGEASFYSRAGCLGCNPNRTMANGQPLNDNALTMAIGADKKHLVGRTAKVTSLATGKSTMVRITDTGGFYKSKYGNRVADLTIATKAAIGMAGGVGQVRVEVF